MGKGTDGRTGVLPDLAMGRRIVTLRYGGRRIGLYRVKPVGEVGMLLNHGGISFPVGTRLDVEDFSRSESEVRPSLKMATVVDNTPGGLRLAWCARQAGEGR
jgi:hypothetical protein